MGDRAPATFTVYTCPDQHTANKIIGIAHEYNFTRNWGEDADDLILGEPFTNDDLSLGNDYYIGQDLKALGVVAEIQQDAKYEYDGTVCYTHPELGWFETTGGNQGVLIPAAKIEEVVDKAAPHEVGRVLLLLTGKPWRDAIGSLRKEWKANPVTWTYDPEHHCENCEVQ